ncbi:MarR family winged helix-turn-helix transcriptional regulator [Acidaminobacterium chupaoyuni]
MNDSRENLNAFLVKMFQNLMKIESDALIQGEYRDITVRDMHILEEICRAETTKNNQMTSLAQELGVTTGTLTVAVNGMVKKGYLERSRDEKDRRIVRIFSTEQGRMANMVHAKFHEDMVEAIMNELPENEVFVLVDALKAVSRYFESKR